MWAGRVLTMVMVVGLTGCATTFWWGNKSTTLSLGMTKEQVQALLGPPQQAIGQELNGMMVETWRYLDRIVTFRNGLVYSWQAGPHAEEQGGTR